MIAAYSALAQIGVAHSVEVWDENSRLVGGVYGVRAGQAFTGESMFYKRTNASKVALVALASRFAEAGGAVIDTQFESEHLKSMGARTMPSAEFEALCGADATGPLSSSRSAVSDLVS
jgi:leucyl/phenylalanyl-tRNA--protein transferase